MKKLIEKFNNLSERQKLIGLTAISIFLAVGYLIWRNRRGIIRIASKYEGLQEISGNMGFKDKYLETEMRAIGWTPGAEWCAFFVKMAMLKTLVKIPLFNKRRNVAEKLLHGSSQQTFINFQNDKSGLWEISTDKPKAGAIVIWQQLGNAAKGHAGIVIKVNGDNFETMEGNVNLSSKNIPSDGEVSHRKYSIAKELNGNSWGCKLRGFINPK